MADEPTNERAARRAPGCLITMGLAGAIALAGGTYLMSAWDTLSGGGKTSAVFLVVLGTLLLLPALAVLILQIVIKVVIGRVTKAIAQAGGDILGNTRKMYETIHEFRDATDEDFDGLNRTFYDDTQQRLESRGFHHIGDLVDETIEQLTGTVAVIRLMVGPDATTQVAFYHLPVSMSHMPDTPLLTHDVTTEFTDGDFLVTSNTAESNLMDSPPQIHADKHPIDTPLDELLVLHETERQKLLAAKGADGGCVTISTREDAIASEKRQQAIKNAFRKGVGYVKSDEVRRIAATVQDASDDDDIDLGEATARAVEDAKKRQQDS